MIANDQELKVTLERIARFQEQVAHLRRVETNPENFHGAVSGFLAEVDRNLFGAYDTPPSRLDVLDRFVPYVEAQLAQGARLNQMTRHILGLFHGQPRARAFRRHLAENAHLEGAGIEVLLAARRIIARDECVAVAAE